LATSAGANSASELFGCFLHLNPRPADTPARVNASLQDNVLYLKHNLNSRAIASLKGEFANINADVTRLVSAMQKTIDESNKFVEQLRGAS
jgi:hypothetical protein